jgi:hypothetical protein
MFFGKDMVVAGKGMRAGVESEKSSFSISSRTVRGAMKPQPEVEGWRGGGVGGGGVEGLIN